MSRGDIANYLRLAAETVSRVLSRFRSQGLIRIEGRELELLKPDALHQLGQALLPD
jgi:CRP/FNR family transcriptional regulator